MNRLLGMGAAAAIALSSASAMGGVVFIDGTDSNSHGFSSGTGNAGGWLYIQRVLEEMAPAVGNGNRVVVNVGNGSSTALSAITSAFDLSTLPTNGWSLVTVDGAADIGAYLDGGSVGGASLATTGIVYLGSSGETGGDRTSDERAAVNSRGVALSNFVGGNGNPTLGGGLFGHTESNSTAAPSFGWLSSVLPGVGAVVGQVSSDLNLTPAGMAALPGLTNADLSTGPWHNYFTPPAGSDFSPLDIVATAAPRTGAAQEALILGGITGGLSNQGPTVMDDTIVVTEGQLISITITASDPNGDPLAFLLDSFTGPQSPINAPTFDPTTQLFTWQTALGEATSTWSAVFRATDPSGLTDLGTVTINVLPVPEPASLGLISAGTLLLRRRR